ncbi:MAG: NAD(P)-binding domain-containing protein [Alphaproteobacteria bacterium]|nr:NAD(P)-binding domain-containing protein [Alphaproteobacteria bacterium]
MTKIALLGAGGKMGIRLATNLKNSRFEVAHVEISETGRQKLRTLLGIQSVERRLAVGDADIIILAVPDALIGRVAHQIIHEVKSGAALIVLDAAAPHAGEMPNRADVTYFCTHPCHPPLFGNETELAAQNDFFGGIKAKQGIVCALIQGPEAHYAGCEEVARIIYSPVVRSHRCDLEHIAILEPALSETIGATLSLALREATDEAVRRGVPKAAARDFILGHLNIELAIAFGAYPDGQFSDGALQAIEQAKPVIFQNGWLDRIFDPDAIKKSVRDICNPNQAAQ